MTEHPIRSPRQPAQQRINAPLNERQGLLPDTPYLVCIYVRHVRGKKSQTFNVTFPFGTHPNPRAPAQKVSTPGKPRGQSIRPGRERIFTNIRNTNAKSTDQQHI